MALQQKSTYKGAKRTSFSHEEKSKTDFDWVNFYEKKVRPKLNLLSIFSDLQPELKGDKWVLGCPAVYGGCGKREAYCYKNNDLLCCNRLDKCRFQMGVLAYLNDGVPAAGSDFISAVKKACELSGIPVPEIELTKEEAEKLSAQERRQGILRNFIQISRQEMHKKDPCVNDARQYLLERGCSEEQINSFGFHRGKNWILKKLEEEGYLPSEIKSSGIYENWDNRVIMPWYDVHGLVIDVFARDVTGKSNLKCLHMSKERGGKQSSPLGLHEVKSYEDLIAVEGLFDYLTLQRCGIENTIAFSGAKFTKDFHDMLNRKRTKTVTLFFDNDEGAGKAGAIKAIEQYCNSNITLFVVPPEHLGDSKDPDDFAQVKGRDALRSIIDDGRIHGFKYKAIDIIRKHKARPGGTELQGERENWTDHAQNKLLEEAIKFEKQVKNPKRRMDLGLYFWETIYKYVGLDKTAVQEYRKVIEEQAQDQEFSEERARYAEEFEKLTADGKHDAADKLKKPQLANKTINLCFISEKTTNYLKEDAPKKPALVEVVENADTMSLFIPKGIVGGVISAGGVGKTHLLAQLGLAVATGEDFLTKFTISQRGNVALILGENDDDDIHRLLRKMAKGKSEEILEEASRRIAVKSCFGENATLMCMDKAVGENKATAYYNGLVEWLKSNEPEDGWSLIILDPLSRFLGVEAEKDNAAATALISLLEKLTQSLEGRPTVLFGHHMNKGGVGSSDTDQTASRGSSAIPDGIRWQANLDKVKDDSGGFKEGQVCFRVVKSNYTAYCKKHILKRDRYGQFQHLEVLTDSEEIVVKGKAVKGKTGEGKTADSKESMQQRTLTDLKTNLEV